jgi:hypothetical protein
VVAKPTGYPRGLKPHSFSMLYAALDLFHGSCGPIVEHLGSQLAGGGFLVKRDYTVRVYAEEGLAKTGLRRRLTHPAPSAPNSDEEEYMKKIGFLGLLITATLLLTMALPVGAAGPKTAAVPVAAAAPAPVAAPAMPPHPHIDEALEAMRNAKHHLEIAEHDFHGHRAKAIEHLNMAIREAEICAAER